MLNYLVPELQESFNSAFVIDFGNGFGITQYLLYAILVFIVTLLIVLTVGRKLIRNAVFSRGTFCSSATVRTVSLKTSPPPPKYGASVEKISSYVPGFSLPST